MPRIFPQTNSNSIFPAPDQRITPGGGSASLNAQAPVATGSATDPSSILTSYTVNGLFTRLTLEDPTTLSRVPDLGARFSTSTQNVFGEEESMTLGDIMQLMLWTEDASPPSTDLVIWAALTVGALSSTSFGILVALENASSVWRVQHAINTGSGWTYTNAAATSGTTRGAILQAVIGTDDSQGRIGAFPIDAAGIPVGTANSESSPSAMTGWTVTPNTLTWGAGWATGSGGSAGTVAKLSPRLILLKRSNIENTTLS